MKDWQTFSLGLIIMLGFIGLQAVILLVPLSHPVSTELLDTWSNITMLVVGYYFGSSSGSKAKEDVIAKLTNAPPVAPSTVPPTVPPQGG